MRLLFVIISATLLSGCSGLKRVNQCEEKVYLGCPAGKLQCGTDDKGCKVCHCQL